uniref:Mucolipin TRP cation channel 2 n=1 Tax=Anolis carolinensis TaxID=28377 RepID=H9GQA3_ANOCA
MFLAPSVMALRYLGKGRALVTRSMMTQPDEDCKEEQLLRQDLKFYFMNPCEKYRARRQIPWKLGLQILKIVMVTTQLILFGLSNQLVVSFKEENMVAFKHLFLKNYSGVDEDDYSCSVYTQQDVYDSIFFAINQYRQLKNISLGTLGYEQDEEDLAGLQICKKQYRKGTMLPSNDTLHIDSTIETECIQLDPQELATKETNDLKNSSFFSFEFYRLIQVDISFKLKGIDLQTIHDRELPDCYEFENTITFNNRAHSGKMKIFFDTDADIQECKDWNISGSIQKNTQYLLIFDGFVIVSCIASLILCTRSIILALKLQKRFVKFFLEKYKRHVCSADRLEFLNGWYVLVIVSDMMTIIGSIMKMEIKAKNLTSYDVCSILLGTSTLFVWVGVIRYLGYFQTYNVLILTMQASLPKVLRFCCCAGMIYLGYTFCGWIVLGPYHEKFEDPWPKVSSFFRFLLFLRPGFKTCSVSGCMTYGVPAAHFIARGYSDRPSWTLVPSCQVRDALLIPCFTRQVHPMSDFAWTPFSFEACVFCSSQAPTQTLTHTHTHP